MDHDRWNGTGTADAENNVHVSLCGTHVSLSQVGTTCGWPWSLSVFTLWSLTHSRSLVPQDATSHNCGTTAWDASFVLAKWLERNLFTSLVGKTVVELGSGIAGLPGMACSLLGAAQVVLTDIDGPVLALLRKNVERNVSVAQISMNGSALNCAMKRAPEVLELRWGVGEDIASCADRVSSIDYILCADCVYNENAVGILLETIVQLLERRGKRTTKVLVCNEYRSETVHQTFLTSFAEAGFGPLKKEKEGSMHPDYRHELIHVYKMKRKTS